MLHRGAAGDDECRPKTGPPLRSDEIGVDQQSNESPTEQIAHEL